jgi:hypothetical protein
VKNSTPVYWLGSLALVLAVQAAAPAAAQTTGDILGKFKMIGTRAVDCSLPPSGTNPYIVNRIAPDGKVMSDFIGPNGNILSSTEILDAAEIAPDKLRIKIVSAKDPKDLLTVTMLVTEQGTRSLSSVLNDGKEIIIADGRILAANRETDWLHFCPEKPPVQAEYGVRGRQGAGNPGN